MCRSLSNTHRILTLVVCICVFSIMSTSCATVQKIRSEGDKETVRSLQKTALLELYIAVPGVPMFPLIDAGIYKSRFNGIAPQIMDLHGKRVGAFTESLGNDINKIGGKEILFGKALIETEKYKNLAMNKIATYPTDTKNERFPFIAIQEGSSNFIDLSEPNKTLDAIFNEETFKENISNICWALEVDGVIVGVVGVPTMAVGPFGFSGMRMFWMELYYFNANGQKIMTGHAQSDTSSASPTDFASYERELDNFNTLSRALVESIYNTTTGQKAEVAAGQEAEVTKDGFRQRGK